MFIFHLTSLLEESHSSLVVSLHWNVLLINSHKHETSVEAAVSISKFTTLLEILKCTVVVHLTPFACQRVEGILVAASSIMVVITSRLVKLSSSGKVFFYAFHEVTK